MSTVARLPDGLYESAKQLAALQGRQPGDLLAEAWNQYVLDNRHQLAADMEQAAKMLRDGDPSGLSKMARETAKRRSTKTNTTASATGS